MAGPNNAFAPIPVNALAPYFGNPNITAQGAKARALKGGYASPEQVTEAGKAALGFTPIVGDVLSGYDAIQAARQGNYGEAALNAIGLLPFVPSMAGVFIGKGAKTWNQSMNDLAQRMEKQGATAEQIWEKTGNFKGPEGSWRQEISDAVAKFRTNFGASGASKANEYKAGIEGPVGGMYEHPELYKAYPEMLRNDRMTVTKLPDWLPPSVESGMHSRTFSGKGRTEIRSQTEPGALGMTTHELQHAIQYMEGLPSGGTEAMFGVGEEAFKKYRLLAGEAEARAAAARRAMTNEQRRAVFPLSSYDVPLNQLIYKK